MAYRVFEETVDTRPIPSGFATGFNPALPSAAQVEAVKQKAAIDKKAAIAKDPTIALAEGAKRDAEFLAFNKGEIQKYIDRDIERGQLSDEVKGMVKEYNNYAAKSQQDLAVEEEFINQFSKDNKYKNGFSILASEYRKLPLNQRPPAKEYYSVLQTNPEKYYDLSVASKEAIDNLYEKEIVSKNSSDTGGVMIDKETFKKGRFINGQVPKELVNEFLLNPANLKTVQDRRKSNDIALVNARLTGNTFNALVPMQQLDGTIIQEQVEYKNKKELAEAVANGEAVPVDASGNPIAGFETGFNTELRDRQTAENYLRSAAGYTTKNETKFKVDEDKAPKRNALLSGSKRVLPDVEIAPSTINNLGSDSGIIVDALASGQDLPDASYGERPFITTSISNKDGVQPIKLSKSTFNLANNGGQITNDVNVNGFTPVFFDADNNVVIPPSNYTPQQQIDYLSKKKGLKQGLIMVGVIEKDDKTQQQVFIEVQSPKDRNFVNYTKRLTGKADEATGVFNDFINLDPSAKVLKEAKNTNAFKAKPTPKNKKTNSSLDVT